MLQGMRGGEPAGSQQHLPGVPRCPGEEVSLSRCSGRGGSSRSLHAAWDPGSELNSHGRPSVPCRQGLSLDTRSGSEGKICSDIS